MLGGPPPIFTFECFTLFSCIVNLDFSLRELFTIVCIIIISIYYIICIVNCFGFAQLVDKPIRGRALLDLILTNTPDHLSNVDVDCSLGNSDHNIVYFNFNVFISHPPQAPKIVYDYKNANWKDFRSDKSPTGQCIFREQYSANVEQMERIFLRCCS